MAEQSLGNRLGNNSATDPPKLVLDLKSVAAALPTRHSTLAKKIAHFSDAHSAHTDLTASYDMLLSIEPALKASREGTDWASHAISALTISAIVLYVRATKSTSKHRRTFDLRHRFDRRGREIHAELVALRDDALAHFGPGRDAEGTIWNEERLFLPLDRPDGATLLAASKRIAFPAGYLHRIIPHAHRTMMLLLRECREREDALIDAIHLAFEADPDFPSLLSAHNIDPATVFGEHQIKEIFDGDRQGMITGLIWN